MNVGSLYFFFGLLSLISSSLDRAIVQYHHRSYGLRIRYFQGSHLFYAKMVSGMQAFLSRRDLSLEDVVGCSHPYLSFPLECRSQIIQANASHPVIYIIRTNRWQPFYSYARAASFAVVKSSPVRCSEYLRKRREETGSRISTLPSRLNFRHDLPNDRRTGITASVA
jgi:hypothetical protein